MDTQKRSLLVLVSLLTALSSQTVLAQSKKYQRPKAAAPAASSPSAAAAEPAVAPATGAKDEKLDIKELEQKYWAPKDTDFSVVQNRTYTKAGRFNFSLLMGPIVNDAFSSGQNYSISANYYLDERHGFEFMYIQSDLENSDVTDTFLRELSGGQTAPDFNRPTGYYGVGYNFVPFYAKMSFMGQKIIYFDMQVTPHIGLSSYEQQTQAGDGAEKTGVFSYGLDVTQYFFFSKNLALRANLHNRWYDEKVVSYKQNQPVRSDTANVTNFLFGVTLFF